CGRAVVSPAIVLAACLLFGLEGTPARVYLVMAAMPAMNQSVLVAKNAGADDLLSARLLSASALIMLVTVPVLVMVAEKLL
ncbi:MAG: AEC family transporter, partial [Clostridia bacterium]|nr:AEC family transporter [Clostridia bacterium]